MTTLPTLPTAFVDIDIPTQTGSTIHVAAGGNLQTALDSANYGDTITLEAGASFTATTDLGFILWPNHGSGGASRSGTGWIVVRTNASDASLPAPGTRIDPSYAAVMPKIVGANSGSVNYTILAEANAHHWRFIGCNITAFAGRNGNVLMALGSFETSNATVPHHLVIDRCYVHGDPTLGARRGVQPNGAHQAVIDSYITDCFQAGFECQAIGGWNGPGPFKVINNHLQSAGENLFFGGATPANTNVVPSDIEIKRNYLYVPLTWWNNQSTYNLKNLFELKSAQRVLFEGNILENMQPGGQTGHAMVIQPQQDGGWQEIHDLTIRHNIIRHCGGGAILSATGAASPPNLTSRVWFHNNLWIDLTTAIGSGGANGMLFLLRSGVSDLTITHNTSVQEGDTAQVDDVTGLVISTTACDWRDNIHCTGFYAHLGAGGFFGEACITHYWPTNTFTSNVLIGPWPTSGGVSPAGHYPVWNGSHPTWFPDGTTLADCLNLVGFTDWPGGDYRLLPTSAYYQAGTDGKDIGVDFNELEGTLATLTILVRN